MQRISPELALVDAELARIARVLLPDPWDPLALRFQRAAGPSAPQAGSAAQPIVRVPLSVAGPREQRTRRQARRSPRRLYGMAAGALVLVGVLVGPGLVDDAGEPRLAAPEEPALHDASKPATPSMPTPAARPPAQSTAPDASARVVKIAWPAHRSADVYNVILIRKGMRIDVWSRRTTLPLTAGPSGSARRVAPGTYKWFVYPGVRRGGKVAYGALIAQGVVRARAR